ncbi:FG-GAP repeat protein [Peristeroidobacter agariperforans]|uniref:FG-GAP repeat protein n=1 Tax=Peristeroidobacter agariperforans TaxID=268404 RepID=UPI0013006BCC|nr:FG-GAP repeat protein [Peristeroidobacter agariperforans]
MRNDAYVRRGFGRWRRVFPLLLLFNSALALADPAVLLETARLMPADGAPDGGYGRSVAIDGNIAVIGATSQQHPGSGTTTRGAAYVFERNSQGAWQQTAKLVGTNPPDAFGFDVAVDGNVIAVGDPDRERVHVFEKQGSSWVRTAQLGLAPSPTYGTGNGFSVAVQGDLIAISHRDDNGLALYRRSSAGWQRVASYSDSFAEEDPTYMGPHVDVTAGAAVFGTPSLFEHGPAPGHLNIYSPGANGDWATPTVTSWEHPDINGDFNGPVSISGNTLLAAGWIFERNSNGTWELTNTSTRADALDDDESTVVAGEAAFQLDWVYQRDASGAWPRVAELTTSVESELNRVDINSKRVVAAGAPTGAVVNGQAFVFELPTTLDRPALLQDGFQDGNAQGWTPLGGSFSVVSGGTSLVYRQTNTTGNAAALLANASYPDQSIQADIVPRAFDGTDRWFGLVARYVNSTNYYYVTARSGGGVQLKKMVGGSFTTLGSAPLTVTLNRTHRLRLEAVGDHVRVLVNDRPVISVRDDDISGGQPGVMMYRTRADYDNVLVNANPGVPAVVDDFTEQRWKLVPTTGSWSLVWWGLYLQEDLTGGASLLTNTWGDMGTYGDQIVEADLRPTQFDGADRWIGLAARHIDANNYVYVTLRSSNTLQIKKLVNGAIQTLASVPFSVATNTTYRVRLETVGSRVRAYVNGELRLEAADVTNTSVAKRAGVVMYKTAAEVDNFSLFQP